MLMLDEATNSLDSAAEVAVQKALEEVMRGRTTIVIAHRLATTCKMDKIYVLQRGGVGAIEFGGFGATVGDAC